MTTSADVTTDVTAPGVTPGAPARATPAPPRKRDLAAYAVFTGLVANAASAFSIQAYMTYGFAVAVWRIPGPLCVALIIALDVFAIMFMILTYLLRGTGWPRGVATCVFLFAVGAQVFAAEMFGAYEQWPAAVRWFSAFPAVFLALAQEGVIVWRMHRNRTPAPPPAPPRPVEGPREPVRWPPAQPTATESVLTTRHTPTPLASETVFTDVPAGGSRFGEGFTVDPAGGGIWLDAGDGQVRADGPNGHSRRPQRRAAPVTLDGRKADAVRRVVDGGEDAAAVARDIVEKPRNVQNWAKAERARRAAQAPATSRDVTAPAPADGGGIGIETDLVGLGPSDAPAPIGE